jgi:hypothetical protein
MMEGKYLNGKYEYRKWLNRRGAYKTSQHATYTAEEL